MPRVVRWYLRTALVMFVLALLVGIFQALGGMAIPVLPGLTPVYFHLLMVGWVSQFILGVAIWMLPKYSTDQPRGMESLSWAAYVLLNLGLLARAIAEPLNSSSPGSFWGWLLVASALCQWVAGLFFVVNAWRRVKGR
jgi:hypothetical protein